MADLRGMLPDDHPAIAAALSSRWDDDGNGNATPEGAAHRRDIVPLLWCDYFWPTSTSAYAGDELVGFLLGFPSPGQPGEAYDPRDHLRGQPRVGRVPPLARLRGERTRPRLRDAAAATLALHLAPPGVRASAGRARHRARQRAVDLRGGAPGLADAAERAVSYRRGTPAVDRSDGWLRFAVQGSPFDT